MAHRDRRGEEMPHWSGNPFKPIKPYFTKARRQSYWAGYNAARRKINYHRRKAFGDLGRSPYQQYLGTRRHARKSYRRFRSKYGRSRYNKRYKRWKRRKGY